MSLGGERWRAVDRLFAAALELPPGERATFLERECAGDAALRLEIEALLASDRDDGFLEETGADEAARLLVERERRRLVGRHIGRFEVLDVLGAGGMGEVYLARDPTLERQVALKRIPRHLAADVERAYRFRREALAASALNHPNIVTVHEIVEHRDRDVLVMELVRGRSLRAHLDEAAPPVAEALRIALEAARGLAAAHAIGIAHRDVKPDNLMLRDDGMVKVLDFGLAGLENDGAAGARGLGTAAYVSPEQASGAAAGKPADVWALGCVLFEMLAGRRAFEAASVRDTLDAVRDREPEWTKLSDETSPPVVELLRLCLAKEPSNRPPIEVVVQRLAGELAPRRGEATVGRRASTRHALVGAASLSVLAALVLAALLWQRPREQQVPGPPTLAVLPFEWIGEPERAYLADGWTEETIASLGHIGGDRLRVIGRRSVLAYAEGRKPLVEIGRELGASLLIEGALRQDGETVRVTAALVQARDQVRLWSVSLDGDVGRLLDLQRELSLLIGRQVRVAATDDAARGLARRQTRSSEAYDLYLRGRRLADLLTPETNRQAIDHYRRAIQWDPDYALAWSGIAFVLAASPINGDTSPDAIWSSAAQAAARAVDAEPGLAEAHTARGMIQFFLDWQWREAEVSLRRSIELDPSAALSHRLLGHVLSQTGRHQEARDQMERARALDPFYAMNHANASQIAFQARDYELAVTRARSAIAVDPGFWIGHVMLGQASERLGQDQLALDSYLEAARLSGGNSKALAFRAHLLATTGRTAEARELLRALEDASARRYVPPYSRALVRLGLGDRAAALAELAEAYESRDVHLVFLTADPRWDALRSEPAFGDLLRRCGFPAG